MSQIEKIVHAINFMLPGQLDHCSWFSVCSSLLYALSFTKCFDEFFECYLPFAHLSSLSPAHDRLLQILKGNLPADLVLIRVVENRFAVFIKIKKVVTGRLICRKGQERFRFHSKKNTGMKEDFAALAQILF